MRCKAEHLRQIAHRCFGRVGLPIRVRCERDRGADRKIRRNTWQMLRVPGHEAETLKSLDNVGQDHRRGTEEQHCNGILRPAHLLAWINAGEAIQHLLARYENWIEPCSATLEDAGHVTSHRLCEKQNQSDEERDLQPTVQRHLELLRTQKSVDEVDE
jgi:hypothetical protein